MKIIFTEFITLAVGLFVGVSMELKSKSFSDKKFGGRLMLRTS